MDCGISSSAPKSPAGCLSTRSDCCGYEVLVEYQPESQREAACRSQGSGGGGNAGGRLAAGDSVSTEARDPKGVSTGDGSRQQMQKLLETAIRGLFCCVAVGLRDSIFANPVRWGHPRRRVAPVKVFASGFLGPPGCSALGREARLSRENAKTWELQHSRRKSPNSRYGSGGGSDRRERQPCRPD